MAEHSTIEWTDATWNPITGCSLASPGCTHCYAMTLAGTRLQNHPSRAGLTTMTRNGPVWTGEVRFNEQWLDEPLRWRRPRRIFVCAHGDLFHEEVPWDWIGKVWDVMRLAPHHTFQVLTKRPARAREWMRRCGDGYGIPTWLAPWPLPNVWLGVSVEDQRRADERVPDLLATPAAIRFVSAEPLLGAVDLARIDAGEIGRLNALLNAARRPGVPIFDRASASGARVDWVICGGESGPHARPMQLEWARAIRDQCAAAGVPFFFKQWGSWIESPPILTYDEGEAWAREIGAQRLEFHSNGHTYAFVGKKRAGRLLDGVEHNGMPAQNKDDDTVVNTLFSDDPFLPFLKTDLGRLYLAYANASSVANYIDGNQPGAEPMMETAEVAWERASKARTEFLTAMTKLVTEKP